MNIYQILRRSLNLLKDIIFTFFVLRNAKADQRNRTRVFFGILSLFLYFLLFTSEDGGLFSAAFPRLIVRVVAGLAYLILAKDMRFDLAFYDSLLTANIVTLVHNLFMTPLTRPILLGRQVITGVPSIDPYLCVAFVHLISIGTYYLIYRNLNISAIKNITAPRIIYNLLLTIAVLYSNSALRFTSEQVPEQIIEFSILSIILQISLLICFIVLEKVVYENRVRLEESERRHAAEALLKNTLEKEKADQELRKYRHDMKNHLSTLSYLIEKNEVRQAQNYLKNLSVSIPESGFDVRTGNLVLDALLSQKFNEARKKNINLTMNADLKPLSKLDDHDLCIVFGNALDNAISAAEKNKDDPFISIRSEVKADYYLLTFENNYLDEIIIEDDELISTKEDRNNHGFGIKNIIAVTGKYNGHVRYHINDEKKRFTLILALPLD